jgi:hypothetical protein
MLSLGLLLIAALALSVNYGSQTTGPTLDLLHEIQPYFMTTRHHRKQLDLVEKVSRTDLF